MNVVLISAAKHPGLYCTEMSSVEDICNEEYRPPTAEYCFNSFCSAQRTSRASTMPNVKHLQSFCTFHFLILEEVKLFLMLTF